MDVESLAVAADRNLAAGWAMMGRAAGFPVAEAGPITATASGLPIAFFNGAFAVGPAADPDEAIRDVLDFFAARQVPYLLWVRAGSDEPLVAAARAAGLTDAGGPPLMALAAIPPAPPVPEGLEISLAVDAADLEAHREVLTAGFGMPPVVAQTFIGRDLLSQPDLAVAVGRVDGVPVSTALLARTGDTAGVYNVATSPGHQRKGYGEAATWAVVAEGARRGCTHAVLQASEAGYPVYLRMGFDDIGRYQQLMGPPAA
jgi:GNAT superfamily N-acetyltransferase